MKQRNWDNWGWFILKFSHRRVHEVVAGEFDCMERSDENWKEKRVGNYHRLVISLLLRCQKRFEFLMKENAIYWRWKTRFDWSAKCESWAEKNASIKLQSINTYFLNDSAFFRLFKAAVFNVSIINTRKVSNSKRKLESNWRAVRKEIIGRCIIFSAWCNQIKRQQSWKTSKSIQSSVYSTTFLHKYFQQTIRRVSLRSTNEEKCTEEEGVII